MGSVQRGIEVVEFACGIPHLLKGEYSENVGTAVDTHTVRQPVGVCAGITPFNFPVMVPLWMFPMAIACGNTFILKPSEKVPSASIRMAELFKEAGLPDGVFNVVHGDKVAVDAILHHPGIHAVSFVGSTPIAKYIYETCAKNGKRVQALGGAKNHAVVLPDADLEFAADALIGAGLRLGGRALHGDLRGGGGRRGGRPAGEAARRRRQKRSRSARATRTASTWGRWSPRSTATRWRATSRQGCRRKARSWWSTAAQPPLKEGFFLGTSLFDNVKPEMKIYKDEIFGPVLVVLRVETLEEAIELVNKNPYANGTAIFTESGGAARRFENEIQVGMVGINVPIPVPVAFYSFGGWKNSLFGDLHVHGMEGVKFYTRTKVITTRWPHQDTPAPGLNMPTLG